ncbi:MAG: FecR domain-containing protein [Leptospiraceae bacterium]|nr:FecR domain-containing protein [Leptospiraceae bacterium]MCP5494697.1 FecR domain-containing protein [Leptospiraceae bacterium]
MKEEVYSSLEQKIYEVIFVEKHNELSNKVMFIQQAVGRTKPTKVEFPSVKDLLKKSERTDKRNAPRKVLFLKPANVVYALSAVAMLFLVFFLVRFPTRGKPYATAVSVQGNVHYISMENSGLYSQLRNGIKLSEKDMIISEKDGIVELKLSSGSILKVMPDSKLILRKLALQKEGDSEILLNGGKLLASVTKQGNNHSFRVITPTMVTQVRGTKFSVNVLEDKFLRTKVGVLEGVVSVSQIRDGKIVQDETLIKSDEQVEESIEGGYLKKELPKEDSKELEEFHLKGLNSTQEPTPTTKKVELENSDTNKNQLIPQKQLTERDLLKKYNKSIIESIVLKDQTVIKGVVTKLNENTIEIETPYGIRNIDRDQIQNIEIGK